MQIIRYTCELEIHENYDSFAEQERELFNAAHSALSDAYAPYSHFRVGAAVRLENGLLFKGNNQENAAYPSGLCAERVALFYAMANNIGIPPSAIAVTVDYARHPNFDKLVSPCGACRQVIAEYEHHFSKPIKIYLLGRGQKVCVVSSMSDLLPMLFSGDILSSYK